MDRNLYLHIQEKESALEHFLDSIPSAVPGTEMVSVTESRGRMTAEAVYARWSSPSYNSCAMDGIAVISSHTKGASEEHPVILYPERDYVEADTGDMLLPPYDAVIMAEELIEGDENDRGVKIVSPAHPLANVRPAGEDIVAGEMVLPSNHVIRAVDIPVLLAAGLTQISVVRKPVVGIIPTGDEMAGLSDLPGRGAADAAKRSAGEWAGGSAGISPGESAQGENFELDSLPDGMIMETNSWMFLNLVEEHGGIGKRWPVIPDEPELLAKTVSEAVRQCDIVIINAGSSAGRDDYTVHVIRRLGEVLTHGVSIKPGKPVILGKIEEKPVIGLPGYPVSAYLTFTEFVIPVMNRFLKKKERPVQEVTAKISKTIMSGLQYEEYVRVKLGIVEGQLIASPLARGAGASMSLVRSDGFCVIPRNSEGILGHEEVRVKLLKSMEEIEKTLVVTGSHDIILDVINDLMLEQNTGMNLSSTHVGSLAGLIALKKRETHLAPSHLLCEEDGTYNVAAVREVFPDEKMAIIKGVRRRQGFIVKKGNPRGIYTAADITPQVRYINRQRGAGTRVLFDYLLKQAGMSPEDVTGYENEAATHMSVAVAVQKDNADTGMGIYSCAKALGLDFVDAAYEEYDFVTRPSYLELPYVQEFLRVLRSEAFRERIMELGGYSCEETGEIRYV